MTTLTIPLTEYSIRADKPSTRYGATNPVPWGLYAKALFRPALEQIPANAIIQSASIQHWAWGSSTATFTVQLKRVTGGMTINGVSGFNGPPISSATWSNAPTESANLETVTVVAPVGGSQIVVPCTAEVQAIVNGTVPNWGFHLDTTSATPLYIQGTPSALKPPIMVVTYVVPPAAPTNLHPASGSVTVAKPVLTFDGPADMTSLRAQISATQNWSAPDWDSGVVASAGGILDLSQTTFPGIASGATTYWRAMVHSGGGDSPWSDPVSVTRMVLPTLSITSPTSGSSIPDGTPTVQWALSAGSQLAWQAWFYNSVTGKLYDSTPYTPGVANSWTPRKGLLNEGDEGTFVVNVWTTDQIVATPGAPDYIEATTEVVFHATASVAGITGLAATSPGIEPAVILSGTRASIPDQVVIHRDSKEIARVAGSSVFSGTQFSFTDVGAPINRTVSYAVACITTGTGQSSYAYASLVPSAVGIWLYNPDDLSEKVLILGDDDQENGVTEAAVVHQPLAPAGSDDQLSVRVVRRRLVRYQPAGSISGTLADSAGAAVSDSIATLRAWAARDAGNVYRLVLGNLALDVILGDIDVIESPLNNSKQPVSTVTLNWWGADDSYTVSGSE